VTRMSAMPNKKIENELDPNTQLETQPLALSHYSSPCTLMGAAGTVTAPAHHIHVPPGACLLVRALDGYEAQIRLSVKVMPDR
jgi:hypothetical protein